MDVLAVREAATGILDHARSGKGPVLVEMQTYRYRGHSMSDPAKYRAKEEVENMRQQHDPIEGLKARMLETGTASDDDFKKIEAEIRGVVNAAADFAQTSPEPDPSELWTDVLVEPR
jgi:pyruvate dehydrogenase E1 component alpha subunit